jgi:BlaI family transcriptional regulator, penicillinase repressor
MKNRPTEAEFQVLNILWEEGSQTVRFVNDRLNLNKVVGYTTTLKIMQIMFEKGLVTRELSGRTHVYTPLFRQEEAQKYLLDRMVDSAFGGSSGKLVMRALGDYKASPEELDKIKELIKKIEEESL